MQKLDQPSEPELSVRAVSDARNRELHTRGHEQADEPPFQYQPLYLAG